MDESLIKMRLLLKAEMILFRLQLRHTVRQAVETRGGAVGPE